MNLFDRPFFRSGAGNAFTVLQAFPIVYLLTAIMLACMGKNPMPAIWFAVGVEAFLYTICVVIYRVSK